MHIDALRTEPVVLQHVKSHTKQKDPVSVGNATADLMADHARLLGASTSMPKFPLSPLMMFRNYTLKGQPPNEQITTYKALRTYITTTMKNTVKKSWETSKTQASFLHNSQGPERTIKCITKGLKGTYMGTFIDVLTCTITKPSYVSPEPIHCLYCKHVRKDHRILPLTPKHPERCLVNHREKKTLLLAIQDEIITSWEPEWNHHIDTPDTHPDDCAQKTTSTHHQKMHKSMPSVRHKA
jgi:hypothetical protein